MNENMSEMFKNLSSMMNNNEIPDNVKNFINSFNSSNNADNAGSKSNEGSNCAKDCTSSNGNSSSGSNDGTRVSSDTSNIFENIDMNTIFKMQKIINSMNSTKNDSRTNLLLSLKPYLKDNRKKRVDQCIQFMKMEKVFEVMNPVSTMDGDDRNV